MFGSIEDDLKAFYERNLATHGAGAQGVGWKNEQAQIVRFQQLEKLLPERESFSINDLGCGTGAFADFLAQEHPSFSYTGYDVLEEMITLSREKHSSSNIKFTHIAKASEMKPADFSVASGIFNIRYSLTDADWKDYILDTIAQLHQKSTKGFAFNALTTYSDKEFMKPELFYSDPLFLFDFCKKNFSKNVALLHDYYQYDFTIIVRTV